VFSDGILLGEVGIADFVFDHGPGKPARRALRPGPADRAGNKPEDKIDEISDEEIKNQSEKAAGHYSNLAYSAAAVNPHLILSGRQSKMKMHSSSKGARTDFLFAEEQKILSQ
jgi:hypothetical protein